jgi:hypothetical protein
MEKEIIIADSINNIHRPTRGEYGEKKVLVFSVDLTLAAE